MKQRSKIVALIIVLSMLLSMAVPAFAQVSDLEGHWAKEEISYMVSEGILNGYPDGTFRPNNNISKAEFYKIINGLMGYEGLTDVHFKDVDPNSWMHEHVAKALGAGYLLNLDEEYLNPTELITREEVARIIGYTFKLKENSEPAAEFSDYALISASSVGFVGALKEKGYISGYPDGSFAPAGNITRAEVVKMLYNILTAEGLPKEVDLSDYEAALKAVKEADYTAKSWKEYQKVVKANEMTEENTQEEIDAAIKAIIEAQKDLVKKSKSSGSSGGSTKPDDPSGVNKLALMIAIPKAEKLNEEDYTEESWAVFEAALDIAIEVRDDKNATQKEVDDALDALRDAIDNLVSVGDEEPEVDKSELLSAINEADTVLDEVYYTPETWEVFEVAYDSATEVYDDVEATQDEVDDATEDLLDAIEALELKDPEDPEEPAITNLLPDEDVTLIAGDTLDISFRAPAGGEGYYRLIIPYPEPMSGDGYGTPMVEDPAGHYSNTWTVPGELIVSGLKVEVLYITSQDDILTKIADGKITVIADKSALGEAISFVEELNEDNYTEESWENLQEVLDIAMGVFYDDGATQDEVNDALADLNAAIDVLELRPGEPTVDKTALAAKIVEALALVEANYTEESWAALQTALTLAQAVKDNTEATQEQVDTALAELQAAIDALVPAEPAEEPTIVATFHRYFMNFGRVTIEVDNLVEAAKFDVTYHLSDDKEGNERIETTVLIVIGTPIDTVGYPTIVYNPAEYDTVIIRIYDDDENLIHIFEDVQLVIPE